MIEYTKATGDDTYVKKLQQALVANYGPDKNLLLPWKKDQTGNDDQAFWALSLMSAVEYDFPDPDEQPPASYLEVVKNCWENIVPRWDTGSCNGGFKWQIYPERTDGYNYKNSISNGAVFALSARLARYTGNQTYVDWATKIFDWTKNIGLISDKYEVFDGTDDLKNCTDRDHTEWSYNIGMYLHGAAVMYNVTNGDQTWKKHTEGFLEHSSLFFQPYENATDVMYEHECERGDPQFGGRRECNVDQQSFKAYLSRFLAKTAIMAPFSKDKVMKWLSTSAKAAATSCSGGEDGATCGSKWYIGKWDGTTGVGQQLSALEVTQNLLYVRNGIVPKVAGGEEKPEPKPSSTKPASSTQEAPKTSSTEEAPKTTENKESPSATPAPTSADGTPISSPPTVPSEAPTSKAPTEEAPSSQPAPADDAVESATPGEEGCGCGTTVTVWVPPTTAIPTPPPPPPPPATNATPTHPTHWVPGVSPSAPANTSDPEQFLGAASNTKVSLTTGFSLFVATVACLVFGATL